MQFNPNLDLIVPFEDAVRPPVDRMPYIAVFKKDKKVLVYICDKHSANVSFDMVDFCFSDKAPAIPEIAIVEYGNSGRKPGPWSFQDNCLIYTAAVATRRGLPVVFSDLSDEEMLDVLKKQRPDQNLTIEDLNKVLRAGGPSTKKGEYNLLSHELNLYGRDPYMLKNIAAALNKYDVVLAIFGEGHYRSHRLVLEDMMGKPKYIESVPNTRGDFSEFIINPIKIL